MPVETAREISIVPSPMSASAAAAMTTLRRIRLLALARAFLARDGSRSMNSAPRRNSSRRSRSRSLARLVISFTTHALPKGLHALSDQRAIRARPASEDVCGRLLRQVFVIMKNDRRTLPGRKRLHAPPQIAVKIEVRPKFGNGGFVVAPARSRGWSRRS